MIRALLLLALTIASAVLTSSATLGQTPVAHYYIAPAGDDANDCSFASPCATVQHVDAGPCATVIYCSVQAAAGVYHQKVSHTYGGRMLSVVGPMAGDACPSSTAVVFDDKEMVGGALAPVSGTIFFSQDLSIMTLNCLALASYANGSIGFQTRQYSIGDANNITCIQFAGGACFAANENSKMNIYNPTVSGNSSRWAYAGDLSTLSVGGTFTYVGGTFDVALFSVNFGALLNFYPSQVVGGYYGHSYSCAGGIVKGAAGIPGAGPHPGNVNCQTY